VILDSFDRAASVKNAAMVAKPELLLFSANTETSLKEQVRLYQEHIQFNPSIVSDIAYTRSVHREHLPHRAFAIVDNGDFTEIANVLRASEKTPAVTMVFAGQGVQYPEMGKDLILTDLNFRRDILVMDQVLKTLRFAPEWNLMGICHYLYRHDGIC
jgi:acyl transferase domain-containing protein